MVKKEKVYDFGIFGKWSESTLKDNMEFFEMQNGVYKRDIIYNSPLQLKINSMKPHKPDLDFENLFIVRRGIFGIKSIEFKDKVYDNDNYFEEYINNYIDYKSKLDEYCKQLDKVHEVISKI